MSIPTGGRRSRRGDTEEHPRTSPANSTRGWARPWRGGVDRHQGPQTPIRWARADGPDFRRRLLLGPPGVGCRSPRRRPSNASVVRWIGRDRPVTPSDHGRCSCVWVPGLTNGSPAVPGGGTTDRTGGYTPWRILAVWQAQWGELVAPPLSINGEAARSHPRGHGAASLDGMPGLTQGGPAAGAGERTAAPRSGCTIPATGPTRITTGYPR